MQDKKKKYEDEKKAPATKLELVKGPFDLVALGSSAGGLAAITAVLSSLPADFPTPILVVQHLDPRHRSLMADILCKRTKMKVYQAQEGERLKPGTVYIAPPNRHLLVVPGHLITLSQAELVHFVRPSVDLLFESAAGCYKDRVIAVILTGTGRDGSMGVKAIKKMGGIVIVQDKRSSEFFGMPEAAIGTGDVDFILPLEDIPETLIKLVMKADIYDK